MRVHRNHFGRQIESFVADIDLPFLTQSEVLSEESGDAASGAGAGAAAAATAPFSGVFIRAPIVEKLLMQDASTVSVEPGVQVSAANSAKANVEILGVVPDRIHKVQGGPAATSTEVQGGELNNIVAVRQDNIMGTSFHPELTDDIRIHVWWLEQVLKTMPAAN